MFSLMLRFLCSLEAESALIGSCEHNASLNVTHALGHRRRSESRAENKQLKKRDERKSEQEEINGYDLCTYTQVIKVPNG